MNLPPNLTKPLAFRGSMASCYPRMLWQRLFDIYKEVGCDLAHLDNLLIDYGLVKTIIDELKPSSPSVFIWGCYSKSFQTAFCIPTEGEDYGWRFAKCLVVIECTITMKEVTFKLQQKV